MRNFINDPFSFFIPIMMGLMILMVAGDEMALHFKEHGIEVEKKYMGAANRLEMEV